MIHGNEVDNKKTTKTEAKKQKKKGIYLRSTACLDAVDECFVSSLYSCLIYLRLLVVLLFLSRKASGQKYLPTL